MFAEVTADFMLCVIVMVLRGCVCVGGGGGGESTKSLTKQLSSPSNAIGNGGCLEGNG